MNNSIQQFMKKGVKNIELIIKNFINDGNIDIREFILELNKPLQEL